MKKLGSVVFLLVGLFLLFGVSVYAQNVSDDFNDSVMDSSLWSSFNGDEKASNVSLAEQSNRLEFLADGWPGNQCGFSVYLTDEIFNFDNDFQAGVDFHHSHLGVRGGDEANIEFVLYNWGSGIEEPDYQFCLTAGNYYENGADFKYFEKYARAPEMYDPINNPDGDGSVQMSRLVDDGRFLARYIVGEDRLEYEIQDALGNSIVTDSFTNFTATFDINTFGIALVGASGGARIVSGEVYMDNFQAAAAPEPVSMSLFLLGAGAIALRKRRNTSK